jgi:hypothetical protein
MLSHLQACTCRVEAKHVGEGGKEMNVGTDFRMLVGTMSGSVELYLHGFGKADKPSF